MPLSSGGMSTWNGFDDTYDVRRIDYIFVKNFSKTIHYSHLNPQRTSGRQLSDHFPVMVSVTF